MKEMNMTTVELNDNVYCIYAHINKSNGKMYIGQTNDIKDRWKNKGSHYKKCRHFANALKKYSWDGFKHEIWFDNLTLDEANELEEFYIARYDTTNPEKGYNLQKGGKNHGYHSEETKQLMSEKATGEGNSQWGTHHSEEHKRKIGESVSKAQTGVPKPHVTEKQKAADERLRGTTLTEEQKKVDSEGLHKHYNSLTKEEYVAMANSKCDYWFECEQTKKRYGSFVEIIADLHPNMETTSKAFKRKLQALQDCNRKTRKNRPFENLTFKRMPK